MKSIIIITRVTAKPGDTKNGLPDEFCRFWHGTEDVPNLVYNGDDRRIVVINGPYFRSGEGARQEWRGENGVSPIGADYHTKIKAEFAQAAGEIGCIAHGGPIDLSEAIQAEHSNFRFSKAYGRTDRFYQPIYVPLANSCEKGKIGNVALFDKLWAEFVGNPLFEAKLELLHRCLTQKGAKEILGGQFPKELDQYRQGFWQEILGQLNNAVPEEYKKWSVSDLVHALAKDPQVEKNGKTIDYNEKDGGFDPKYINALSVLRDALLVNENESP